MVELNVLEMEVLPVVDAELNDKVDNDTVVETVVVRVEVAVVVMVLTSSQQVVRQLSYTLETWHKP